MVRLIESSSSWLNLCRNVNDSTKLVTTKKPLFALTTASSLSDQIDKLYKLRPSDFTLSTLFDLQTNIPLVGKFLIIQKVRESLATPFEDAVTQVSKLFQQLELQEEEISKLPSLTDLALNKHISIILDSPESLSGNVVFHLNRIFENLQNSVESHNCKQEVDAGAPTCGVWTDLLDLLAPLEDKPLRISVLIPAMDWLLQHPDGIIMADFGQTEFKKREMWVRRWHRWQGIVDECWAIRKYLDPFYVFLEEADGALYSEVVKSTNETFAHCNPRLPEPARIDVNPRYGSSPLRLRRFGSLPEATQVASALRSHLSVPGSSDGSKYSALAARICTFSCYNMIWW